MAKMCLNCRYIMESCISHYQVLLMTEQEVEGGRRGGPVCTMCYALLHEEVMIFEPSLWPQA
eukprot:scaffold60711_cov65-Attheya_sp.AAC.6